MQGSTVALVAWAGVYFYVAIYYGLVHALRRRHEYGRFASFAGCLGVFSLAAALTMELPSPALAVTAQQLQYIGLAPALAFFVDFCGTLTGESRPTMVRAMYAWAWLTVGAVGAGLFFDPAVTGTYDWSAASSTNRALPALSPTGSVILTFGLGGCMLTAARLIAHAKGQGDLRVAALVTGLAVLTGTFDVYARVAGWNPIPIAPHAALLPVLGFSYVLVGRFTRVDSELEDRTKQLARSYDHLRLAQAELLEKEQLAAVGELSAVIAHEVRNPLAIIKNAVGGLQREELPANDADTLLSILDEETDRLNHLVNDLLAYAKPISADTGQVDLRTLVMRAVELAAGGTRDISQIEIELELSQEVALVEGDETLLRHALINIVDNALQAMPFGGTLTVSCRDAIFDGRASVVVGFHDTGEGMDTLVRSRARDPFFTTRQQGTGLGLAIVDRVARAHGGQVELESRHGQGTTVRFVVPVERSSLAPPSS